MKSKKTAFKSIAWLLSISMLLVWLVGMVAVTIHQTALYEEALQTASADYARTFAEYCDQRVPADLRYANDVSTREDWMQCVNLFSLDQADSSHVLRGFMSWDKIPVTAAVIVYDGEGQEYFSSLDSCLVFSYITEKHWEQGKQVPSGRLWLEMGKDPEVLTALGKLREDNFFYVGNPSGIAGTMRITGYVHGDKIVPSTISYAINESYNKDELEWITVLDRVPSNDGRKVTVYTRGGRAFWPAQEKEETWQGKTYGGLTDQLRKENTEIRNDPLGGNNTLIMCKFSEYKVYRGVGEQKKVAYTVHALVKSSPIQMAVQKLIVTYHVTFLLTVLAVWLVLRRIRRNLTLPIGTLNAQMAGECPPELEYDSEWTEPLELAERFDELTNTINALKDTLQSKENEINQLNQALGYAKQAEENRRKLVSAVAHELKTPLAVIHGYTEGLQEQIAEEKREQYLATILSESERMDKLVMEMLDLSRLEAGRVKLARDTFSLTELTQSVFETLSLEAEKKDLKISFTWGCGEIRADEGRMEQVIRNLASNAVRYTPEGGHIRVRTEKKGNTVSFFMENDAAPFSEETLTKVWETFYRADRARNGKGTGLGLAIVKNIIKLHGGSCSVRNTETGVEFSFRIPQYG